MDSFKTVSIVPVLFTSVLALLLLAGMGSAYAACPQSNPNCCQDLQYDITPMSQSVLQGEKAIYTLTFTNNGLTPKEIRAAAECPSGLSCEFTEMPLPTTINPTESKITHFYVYTNGPEATADNYSIPFEVSASYLGQTCTENTLATGDPLALDLEVQPTAATPASAPLTATLTPSTQQVAQPADTVDYELKLTNNLDSKIYVTVGDEGNPFAESTFYSYSTVQLDAGETKTIDITLKVPPGTPGHVYDWSILVRSSLSAIGQDNEITIPVSLQVYAKTLAVSLLNAPFPFDCQQVQSGDSVEIPLSLENTGEVAGPFALSLEGSDGGLAIASLDQQLIQVKPGEQADFKVTLAPSKSATLDEYSIVLVGKYHEFEFLREALCFNVVGYEQVKVIKPLHSEILRTETTSIPFTVTNQGTIAETISFDWTPIGRIGTMNLEPSTLNLTPGQKSTVNLVISTSLNSPLEDYSLPLILRAKQSNFSMGVNFNVSVVASNRPGESFLQILPATLQAAEEGTTTAKIRVMNNGKQTFNKVTLAIEGISKDWFSIDYPRPIEPGKTAEYTITFTPPVGSSGTHAITLYAFDGKEGVKQDAELEITPYLDDLKMSIMASSQQKEQDQVSAIILSVRVTNDGGQTLTNIAPVIFSDEVQNYNYEANPSSIDLNPGEQADVSFTLKPNSQTAAKTVPISLSSTQGKSAPSDIGVPSMKAVPQTQQTPFPWKTMAIIALLVIILAVFAHENQEQH